MCVSELQLAAVLGLAFVGRSLSDVALSAKAQRTPQSGTGERAPAAPVARASQQVSGTTRRYLRADDSAQLTACSDRSRGRRQVRRKPASRRVRGVVRAARSSKQSPSRGKPCRAQLTRVAPTGEPTQLNRAMRVNRHSEAVGLARIVCLIRWPVAPLCARGIERRLLRGRGITCSRSGSKHAGPPLACLRSGQRTALGASESRSTAYPVESVLHNEFRELRTREGRVRWLRRGRLFGWASG